jgi:hypothetical protein
MTATSIVHFDRLDLSFAPKPWEFANARRAEIDAHFAACKREKPALWNGRVLLLHDHAVADGVFRGSYLETDFASFVAWRDWGRPAAGAQDCFGAAALVASDNACLLGVMGAHTINAGRIYFPCGTPDPSDIVDGKVDLDASEFQAEPGWTTVLTGALIAHIKVLRARETAVQLRLRILDHLARERQPELADIRIVRGRADFDPMMPDFVTALLAHLYR